MEIHHHLFVTLLLVVVLLLPLSSSQENTRSLAIDVNSPLNTSPISQKLNPKIVYEIKVHGFMLWASMGVLMPIGIISIRLMSIIKGEPSVTQRRLFFLHFISQMAAVVLVTIGAIMSIKNFNNSFNNLHQRLGVGLYAIVWFQALLGFLRPPRGGKARRNWFIGHWILGTSVAILGIITIYTGLNAYTKKTSKSAKLWTILFTAQLSFIVLLYVFQDKWSYIQSQTDRTHSVDHNSNISTAEPSHGDVVEESKPALEKC